MPLPWPSRWRVKDMVLHHLVDHLTAQSMSWGVILGGPMAHRYSERALALRHGKVWIGLASRFMSASRTFFRITLISLR